MRRPSDPFRCVSIRPSFETKSNYASQSVSANWGTQHGLNGGPEFSHSEAFSFQVATDYQEETDRYWNVIVGNGGQENQCGWCKDRWGLNWQITPRVRSEAFAAGGAEAKRAFEAMMPMKKIDIATIETARCG
ncbi:MAG: VOC family protein [Gemmatimonadaceae bacterium]|nr:VOC family protein [Gemmatimonadaceae bacterium]